MEWNPLFNFNIFTPHPHQIIPVFTTKPIHNLLQQQIHILILNYYSPVPKNQQFKNGIQTEPPVKEHADISYATATKDYYK